MSTGGKPGVYPRAVCEKTHKVFRWPPYQSTCTVCQGGYHCGSPRLAGCVGTAPWWVCVLACRGVGLWWVIQGRIPAQARDPAHVVCDTGQRQRHRGKAPVDHHYQPQSRQPAPSLLHHVPYPVDAGLVRRRPPCCVGEHSAVSKGQAHIR